MFTAKFAKIAKGIQARKKIHHRGTEFTERIQSIIIPVL